MEDERGRHREPDAPGLGDDSRPGTWNRLIYGCILGGGILQTGMLSPLIPTGFASINTAWRRRPAIRRPGF